jgi:cytochrome P450 family 142 subfamily A polypeptide 1
VTADHPTRDDIRLLDGNFYVDDPHEKYDWMREHAPVYFDGEIWGFASYESVMAASKDPSTFSNAQGSRPDSWVPSMINFDDPEHWKRRKLVNRGFTPRRVRDSERELRTVCDAIIDAVYEWGECDFVTDIAAPLPMVVIGDMLGVEPSDRGDLLRWSDDMVSAVGAPSEGAFERAMQAMTEYADYFERVAQRRLAEPTDDLISVILHAEVDGDRLTSEEAMHEALLILVGGDETTRHVITGGMEQLILHPDQRKLLIDDPSKIEVAVEEMLRWVTPIKNMNRTVTRDVEFMGQQLHEGDRCLLLYESANRDEARFPDAHTFNVEREPNEHVAFGFGAHYCLGQALARLELKVMFEQLLSRMPDMEFAADPAGLPRRRANFISGLESMPVRFSRTELSTPVG